MARSDSKQRDGNMTTMLKSFVHNQLKESVHTMRPGVIENFDAQTQRAQVKLANAIELENGQIVQPGLLLDVPIQFMKWGAFVITAPPKKGDEVAIFFSERNMDRFLTQGATELPPTTPRFFDFSDAFAVPGLLSNNNLIQNFSSDALEIKNENGATLVSLTESGVVTVKSAGIEMNLSSTGELSITNSSAELINTLVVLFSLLTPSVVPGNQPAYNSNLSLLNTFL